MKVKQEIIEATYSIEEICKGDYELIKDGLRAIINADYLRDTELSSKGESAESLLELLTENY